MQSLLSLVHKAVHLSSLLMISKLSAYNVNACRKVVYTCVKPGDQVCMMARKACCVITVSSCKQTLLLKCRAEPGHYDET